MTENKERILFLEVIHSTPSLGPYSFELQLDKENKNYLLCVEEGFPLGEDGDTYQEPQGADVFIRELALTAEQQDLVQVILTDKIATPSEHTALEDGTIHFGGEGQEDGTSYELEILTGPNAGKLSWSDLIPPEWQKIEQLVKSFYQSCGFKLEEVEG